MVKDSDGDMKDDDEKMMEMDDHSWEGGLVPPAAANSQLEVVQLPALTGPAAKARMEVAVGGWSDLVPLDVVDRLVQGGEVVKLPFLLQDAGLKHLGLDSSANRYWQGGGSGRHAKTGWTAAQAPQVA